MREVSVVLNTATLHKARGDPRARAVETNVTGTLNLLGYARAAVNRFVSHEHNQRVRGCATTTRHRARRRQSATQRLLWRDQTRSKDLCLLYSRKFGVNCTILRTSRFFPEDDDNKETRDQFHSLNTE